MDLFLRGTNLVNSGTKSDPIQFLKKLYMVYGTTIPRHWNYELEDEWFHKIRQETNQLGLVYYENIGYFDEYYPNLKLSRKFFEDLEDGKI